MCCTVKCHEQIARSTALHCEHIREFTCALAGEVSLLMTLILNMSDPLLLAGEASLLVTLILSMSDPLLL